MLPEQIGRYQIRGELGRGGMATVYRASDPQLGREVALKVLPRELLHDPEFRARFRREVEAVGSLEHPAIVPVYEAGEHDGQPYMAMRLMTGGSLAERLARGPLPLAQAARLIAQLAPALDAAHAAGLVHRDVKPDNVLFDGEDHPYLADFGIVSLADVTTRLTRSGVIGTPDYMAPELTRPGGLSPLVDVYALGVMLFQMLAGRLPYTADTPLGTLVAHVTEPVPDLLALRPELPPDAQAVFARALAKDPRERYQSAGALAADLAALAAGQSLPTLRLAAPPLPARPEAAPPLPEPRLRLTWPLAAVGFVAALLALVGVWSLAGGAAALAPGPTVAPMPTVVLTITPTQYGLPGPTTTPTTLPPDTAPPLTITTGELGMLARQIVVAGYSQPLDALLLVSREPDQVTVIRPPDWDGVTLDLPARAHVLAISPDGTRAAIGHERQITLIELEQGRLLATLPVEFTVAGLALDDEGRVFYTPGELGAQARVVGPDGGERVVAGLPSPSDLALASGGVLFSASRLDAPSVLAAYKVTAETLTARGVSLPQDDACGRVWAHPDSQLAATGCGLIYTGATGPDSILAFKGDLAGLSQLRHVSFAPHGGPLLALSAAPPYGIAPGEQWPRLDVVYVYDPGSLRLLQTVALPPAEWGPAAARSSQTVEARYVFSNAAGTVYYVIVYAPGLRDYGVVTLGVSDGGAAAAPRPPAPLPALGGGVELPAPRRPDGVATRPLEMAVAGAAYSRALDQIVLVAPRPHRLVIFRPEDGAQLVVELPAAPQGLALSPDGLLAAVLMDSGVASVDLQTARLLAVAQLDGRSASAAISDDGRLYVVDQARNPLAMRVFDAALGSEYTPAYQLQAYGYRYSVHPSGRSLYGLIGGIPQMLERLEVVGGEPSHVYWAEASAEHRLGAELWLDAGGTRLFTGCGAVFSVTERAADDLAFGGLLAGVGGIASVYHADAARQILALPGDPGDPAAAEGCVPPPTTPPENHLLVYDDGDLAPLRVLDLPDLEAGGARHPFVGRYVFANNAGTHYYVLVELRRRTAQLPDYHLLIVPAEVLR